MDDKKALLEIFEVVKVAVVTRQGQIKYRLEVSQMYSGTDMFYQTACWSEEIIAEGKKAWVVNSLVPPKRSDDAETSLHEALAALSVNEKE